MTIRLDHTIVPAKDKIAIATAIVAAVLLRRVRTEPERQPDLEPAVENPRSWQN